MAELRIPREEERKQIEEYFECVREGCIHAEALISVTYQGFREVLNPRVRCLVGNMLLNTESKVCPSFERNENKS